MGLEDRQVSDSIALVGRIQPEGAAVAGAAMRWQPTLGETGIVGPKGFPDPEEDSHG